MEYYNAAGYSSNKAAAVFKCSRRAFVRYLNGERLVPMYIVKMMLQEIEIQIEECVEEENKKCDKKEAANRITKNEEIINEDDRKFDEKGLLIWYGNKEMLFNTLYAYRTQKFHQSLFEAACELNIVENILYEYESGRRKIAFPDIQKILSGYDLKIEELFPALVSYDGRKTFLPLQVLSYLEIDGKIYDAGFEEYEEIYNFGDIETANIWSRFPMPRYDAEGRFIRNDMPQELTVDEYVNSSEFFFMDDNMKQSYQMDVIGMKLPPSYWQMFNMWPKIKGHTHWPYKTIAVDVTFGDDYSISIKTSSRKSTFDLSDYVFSDSPWYNMLQDKEYFKMGKLKCIGEFRI